MHNIRMLALAAIMACPGLGGCSAGSDQGNTATNDTIPVTAAAAITVNVAAPTAPAVPGFDPSTAPLATPSLGGWPYFSLIDGFEAMSLKNSAGDSAREFLKDVAFDQYHFYDGYKLIPVEGRLFTTRGNGTGASFFEVKKTYEKLVRDNGGVTVFEGSGKAMEAAKLKFPDRRFRGTLLGSDEMGVYMLRAADREIWVEVYRPWNSSGDNYWLTVVEKKLLDVRARALPAEEMKRALDADGRVALYVNFDTDKTAIKPESAPLITQIVKLLTDNPALRVNVDGHTDTVGAPAKNMTLAQGRANAVVGALIAQGIDPARLKARSFGQSKPLAPNDDEQGRARNRRVELVKQ